MFELDSPHSPSLLSTAFVFPTDKQLPRRTNETLLVVFRRRRGGEPPTMGRPLIWNGGYDLGDQDWEVSHILHVNYLPFQQRGPIHGDRRIAFRLRGAATAVSCSARESGIRRAKAAGAGSHSLLLLFCLYCPFEISRRVGGQPKSPHNDDFQWRLKSQVDSHAEKQSGGGENRISSASVLFTQTYEGGSEGKFRHLISL